MSASLRTSNSSSREPEVATPRLWSPPHCGDATGLPDCSEDAHGRNGRNGLLEQLQPFARQLDVTNALTPVTLPPGRARLGDQADARPGRRRWRRRSGSSWWRLSRPAPPALPRGHDHGRLRCARAPPTSSGNRSHVGRPPSGYSICDVLALDIAELAAGPLRNAANVRLDSVRRANGLQECRCTGIARLLRPRRERPRRRAAEQRDELAPLVAVDTVIIVNGIFFIGLSCFE